MRNLNCEKAFAKINLSLNILNKRNDGYHNLNSDVIFANIYDSIKIIVLNTNNKTLHIELHNIYLSKINSNGIF